MRQFRLSQEAEADLDAIWLHIAQAASNIDIATRVIENLTARFWLLAQYPFIGRSRPDLRTDLRSFPAEDYIIIYRTVPDDVVLILHVLHAAFRREFMRFMRAAKPT